MNLNSCTISFMRSITISWFDFPIYNIYAIMSVIILNEYFSFKEKLNLSMKRTNFKNIFHTNLYFTKRALRILRIQFRTKCDGKFPFTKTISYLVHVEECPTTWYKYRSVSGTWKINRIHGFNRLDTSSWYTIGNPTIKIVTRNDASCEFHAPEKHTRNPNLLCTFVQSIIWSHVSFLLVIERLIFT